MLFVCLVTVLHSTGPPKQAVMPLIGWLYRDIGDWSQCLPGEVDPNCASEGDGIPCRTWTAMGVALPLTSLHKGSVFFVLLLTPAQSEPPLPCE